MTTTYRVVVVREGKPGFTGASGLYPNRFLAHRELGEIARTWVGLAEPQWFGLFPFRAFRVTHKGVTHTYSILQERATWHPSDAYNWNRADYDPTGDPYWAPVTETDVSDAEDSNPFDNYWDAYAPEN